MNAPRRSMRLAASTFPAPCNSSGAATPSSAHRPSPGRARHIHRRVRERGWCSPARSRTRRTDRRPGPPRRSQASGHTSVDDASRYSLLYLSHTPNKSHRDRMAIVYGLTRVANVSWTTWLIALMVVSATSPATAAAPAIDLSADEPVHTRSLSALVDILEDKSGSL